MRRTACRLVDRTQPTGSVTAPASGATVGGPAVALGATAADTGGSGVTLVEWQVKEFGPAASRLSRATPPRRTAPTGTRPRPPTEATEIRAVVTDAAGHADHRDPGHARLDRAERDADRPRRRALRHSLARRNHGRQRVRVQFAVSPADAATWTQIAEDMSAPFGALLDTAALADGLYDLRAIGFDGLGNASAASIREDIRLDNTAPQLVSSAPADGSVSTSANQIVLTASERTAPGACSTAPPPRPPSPATSSPSPTGGLADGLHVLSGELEDASGTRVPFRVAVTIESTPRPIRRRSSAASSSSGDWTLTVPGGLVTVRMPQSAWPLPPTPGLHPRPPRRRRPSRQRLRPGNADRRRHRALGARRTS